MGMGFLTLKEVGYVDPANGLVEVHWAIAEGAVLVRNKITTIHHYIEFCSYLIQRPP
jgi:hypothetical protein